MLHFAVIFVIFKIAGYNILKKNFVSVFIFKIVKFIKSAYFKNTKLKIKIYIPIFLFLFLLILFNNWLGLIPYTYSVTTSLIFNLFIVLTYFCGINIIGIIYHKWNFFNIFAPKGIDVIGLPPLIFLETVSYFARVVSLSVRLFANILSVHILQHILIGFSFKLFFIPNSFFLLFVIPAAIVSAVAFLEFVICFLQAYVITLLMLIYFSNVIWLH